MNFYQLIRLSTREDAEDYGERLSCRYKVIPTNYAGVQMFAVDVPRTYTGGRLDA